VSRQGYAVIVVAEGAGEALLNDQQRNATTTTSSTTSTSSSSTDDKDKKAVAVRGSGSSGSSSSNESPAFGLFLKTQIEKHFVSKGKQVCMCL
jgi:hypothetical protein